MSFCTQNICNISYYANLLVSVQILVKTNSSSFSLFMSKTTILFYILSPLYDVKIHLVNYIIWDTESWECFERNNLPTGPQCPTKMQLHCMGKCFTPGDISSFCLITRSVVALLLLHFSTLNSSSRCMFNHLWLQLSIYTYIVFPFKNYLRTTLRAFYSIDVWCSGVC